MILDRNGRFSKQIVLLFSTIIRHLIKEVADNFDVNLYVEEEDSNKIDS